MLNMLLRLAVALEVSPAEQASQVEARTGAIFIPPTEAGSPRVPSVSPERPLWLPSAPGVGRPQFRPQRGEHQV